MTLTIIMAFTAGVSFAIITFLIELKRMRTREKAFAKVCARNAKAFNGFGYKEIERSSKVIRLVKKEETTSRHRHTSTVL